MTKDQLQQKTSRGETFADLLRRAMQDDGQPPEMIESQLSEETEKENAAHD